MKSIFAGSFVLVFSAALASNAAAQQPLKKFEGHKSPVLSVAWSPDSRKLASVGDDDTLILREAASGKVIATLKGFRSNSNKAAFTPDGASLMALDGNSLIRIIDAVNGGDRKVIQREGRPSSNMALSPDGKTAALIARSYVELYDVESGQKKAGWDSHPGYGTTAVRFTRDGKTLATAGSDRKIVLTSTVDHKATASFPTIATAECLAFSPDGSRLYAGLDSRVLRMFKLAEPGSDGVEIYAKGLAIHDLEVSQDGKRIVVAGLGRGPAVLDAMTGAEIAKMEGNDTCKAVAISPDGKMIACGDQGGNLGLWAMP